MKQPAPAVLDATAAALLAAYWYRNDLKSFFRRVGVAESTIIKADWDGYKRNIIREIFDQLAASGPRDTRVLQEIIDAILDMDDAFPHLARLEDGTRKVADAKAAQKTLAKLVRRSTTAKAAERARAGWRAEAQRAKDTELQRASALEALRTEFLTQMSAPNPQKRGREFNDFLRRLFALHDLNPHGSFCGDGEETDGSIQAVDCIMLVEAKWTESLSSPREILEFRGKVEDKLDNTLGLFISVSGFTDAAIDKASQGRRLLLLMDGQDLMGVLEGRVDLREMLERKRRRAAETGEVLHRM